MRARSFHSGAIDSPARESQSMTATRLAVLASLPLLAVLAGCDDAAAPVEDDDSEAFAAERVADESVDHSIVVAVDGRAWPGSRESLKRLIVDEAAAHGGVPPALALAVARAASDFSPNTLDVSGAVGIMQLPPEVTERADDDVAAVVANVRAALDHLADLHARYDGDWRLALSHFRGGPLRALAGDAGYRSHDYTDAFADDVAHWERLYRRDPVVAAWIRQASGMPRFVDGSAAPLHDALSRAPQEAASHVGRPAVLGGHDPEYCDVVGRRVVGGGLVAVGGDRFR